MAGIFFYLKPCGVFRTFILKREYMSGILCNIRAKYIVDANFRWQYKDLVACLCVKSEGRVGAPLTVVHPSQNSGRAAFPHPALCETNRSHYHSYILTYIRGLTSG